MEAFLCVFKALSNDTRWRILELLRQGPLCVNALACRLEVSQPAVSQHLKLLEHTGLVRGEKMGLQVHYALIPDRLRECLTVIEGLMSGVEKGVSHRCESTECSGPGDQDPKADLSDQTEQGHPA